MIKKNKEWVLADIYADEAITGTQVAKREDFQRMINDCMNGEIDMVITKLTTSAQRRNTKAIPTLTLPVHTSISILSSRNASTGRNPKSRLQKQDAAHVPTAFVWWKL